MSPRIQSLGSVGGHVGSTSHSGSVADVGLRCRLRGLRVASDGHDEQGYSAEEFHSILWVSAHLGPTVTFGATLRDVL